MNWAILRRLLLFGAGILVVPAAVAGMRPVQVELGPVSAPVPELEETARLFPLDSLARSVVEHNPFRIARAPAPVAFSPVPPEPVHAAPPPPRPQLVLSGIVWGTAPVAIIEGLPGIEGARSLRVGEQAGEFRVRQISPTEVTVTGMDTTWVLAVRKPW